MLKNKYLSIIYRNKLIKNMVFHSILLSNYKLLRTATVFLLSVMIYGCIEVYNPPIQGNTEFLVVDGSIVKGNSIQTVLVSKSTSLNESAINWVSGCTVWATNAEGEEFTYEEASDGNYHAEIPPEALPFGSQFMINVITPEGKEYASDFETLYESSPVDSLYFIEEAYQSSSLTSQSGLQYYADLKAEESATGYYRWILEETWEHHSPYLIAEMRYSDDYTGSIYFEEPTDSLSVCYTTKEVSDLYTASTDNLSSNEKKKIPLIYASGIKLNYNYSVLVKQYAMSMTAYDYWSKTQVIVSEGSGLHQTQPSSVTGNICNVNDADEVVLGFFWAASYSEKRLNFKGPLNEMLNENCELEEYDPDDPPLYEPIYFDVNGMIASPICFDCTYGGGSLIKPDFFE
ncbi:DUF4249 domain-containing protein [Saccharicrinis sp. GN24d3]|uniref:DUF4249 domain-containing protein n=1 Tax=Saccharicrinis sp. GN24d3 TaxID=3458416 RepID=UPI0040361E64